MHGIFYKHLEEHGLSEQLTFSFLRSNGVFNTLVYRGRGMGMGVPDTRCRACRLAPETLMHVLSASETYAGTAYVHQQNAALRMLYSHLRHPYSIDETPLLPYAPGNIESVVENERCRIYWNYSLPMLELVQANKPDIKIMFVIEFSAPAEVNIVSKEEKKRTKYQELRGQLRRLCPGSLGGLRSALLSTLRAIPGITLNHNMSGRIIHSNQSLVLQKVTRQSAGKYRCSVVNSEGETVSDELDFRVQSFGDLQQHVSYDHVVTIAKTAPQKLGVLSRCRQLCTPEQLLLLYKAQIQPSLEYCSYVWR
nr:unnamed protein product [Callosobruchus analis]